MKKPNNFDKIINSYLLRSELFGMIIRWHKKNYDALYYTTLGLSRLQRNKLYRFQFKLLKRDVKRLKKLEKEVLYDISNSGKD